MHLFAPILTGIMVRARPWHHWSRRADTSVLVGRAPVGGPATHALSPPRRPVLRALATRTTLNHVVASVRATSLEELIEDSSQLTMQAAHLVVSQ